MKLVGVGRCCGRTRIHRRGLPSALALPPWKVEAGNGEFYNDGDDWKAIGIWKKLVFDD